MAKSRAVEFTVVGSGEFPMDMLRYDGCWPIDSYSAHEMSVHAMVAANITRPRRVTLRAISRTAPTEGRWQSFGWPVEQESVRRYAVEV